MIPEVSEISFGILIILCDFGEQLNGLPERSSLINESFEVMRTKSANESELMRLSATFTSFNLGRKAML